MTKITSAAQFFRESNGKKIIRTMVGGLAAEDWADWVEQTKVTLTQQGLPIENIVDDGKTLSIKGSPQFWMKPRMYRQLTGQLEIRSKDYIFEYNDPANPSEVCRSFGYKKGLKVVDNNLILELPDGVHLQYALVA